MLDRFYLRVVLVQHVAEELTEKLMNSFRSMRWDQTEEWNPATFHKLDGLANNQFFINLVRPSTDMSDVRIYGSTIQKSGDSEKTGVTGSLSFPVGLLEPGETKSYDFEIYSGPKDYMGLKSLGADQKKVMQFEFFGGFLSRLVGHLIT